MRLNINGELKHAIGTNLGDRWDSLTLCETTNAIGHIINQISNPIVYFTVCHYHKTNYFTDYHISDKTWSSDFRKNLEQ